MISLRKRLFWIEKGYTVLLEGKAGVGKTSIVLEAFREANLKFAYFSGSTLDPFIDFCGVPVKIDHPDGEASIKLILPEHMKPEETEAIMLDEYNRAPKKVRNALLELIQFKSINGRKFGKLRVIWVAVNPYSEDAEEDQLYDVERLDPAQRDRFQIQVKIPYKCSEDYFVGKYGKKMAKAAIQWWNDLPDKIKDVVSPRRLDYALQIFGDKGDILDVLPEKSNAARLKSLLGIGPAEEKLTEMMDEGDMVAAKFFLSDPNNYDYSIKAILETPRFLKYFLPALEEERISSLLSDKWFKVRPIVFGDIKTLGEKSHFFDMVNQIARANQHDALGSKIEKELERAGVKQEEDKKKDHSATSPDCNIEFYYAEDATDEQNQEIIDYRTASRSDAQIYDFLRTTLPSHMTRKAAIAAAMILQVFVRKALPLAAHSFYESYTEFGKIRNHIIIQLFKNNVQPEKIERFIRPAMARKLSNDPSVYDIQHFVDNAVLEPDLNELFGKVSW